MTKQNPVFNIALSLLLTSCATLHPPKSDNLADVFPEKKALLPQKPTPKVAEIPVPEFKSALQIPRNLRNSLNVSVHEVDAREFFMGLVVDSDENMVVHPDVKGTISLELKNVTIPQVLDAVQKVYGYDFKKTEIGYVIYPATLQTKTFKIDRLDLLREGKSNTFVSSGQTGNSNSGYGSQQSQSSLSTPQFGNNQNQSNTSSTTTRSSGSSITTTTQTDFWKELEDALHTLLAVDKEASVVINRQSGVVIARAKPMQLREIESFLATTQNQISRQVILEAKILEVVLNDSHQDGVEWKSIIREGLQSAPVLVGNPGTVFTLASRAGSFRAGDFTAVVTLLESQGKTNVLSSPRISTLNNQQAIIKVGRDETFVTGISPGISGGVNSGTVQPVPILSAFFSGIALDVTPQINDNGEITLHIHPSISKVQSLDRKYTVNDNGEQSVVPTALTSIRESDSIVKAENGQIVVLGGLMQDTIDENKEGITGLSRIPYLGNLFRVNTGTSQKSELVILLKATLINNDSDWQNAIENSQQRFKELEAQPRWQ
ncbi:MAG: secretin N-terminal domain-containing protein [Methylococcales bacterium]|nr:pilus (MSHA type) biogenesis protein MshL [Methylococcaceae bacterium]